MGYGTQCMRGAGLAVMLPAMAQDSCGREAGAEEGKAGSKPEEAGEPGEGQGAQVSFLTAALMGVALCFHSILEVRTACLLCVPWCACCEQPLTTGLCPAMRGFSSARAWR